MPPPVTQTRSDAEILADLRTRGLLVEQGTPSDSAVIETAVRAVPGIDRERALGFIARLRGDPTLGPLVRWKDTSPWPTDVPGISPMATRARAIREGLIHPFAYFSGQGSDYLAELEILRADPAVVLLYEDLKPLINVYLKKYDTDVDSLFDLKKADPNQDKWKTYFGINRAGVSFGLIALVQALRIRVMESYGYDFSKFHSLSGQSAGILAALFAGNALEVAGYEAPAVPLNSAGQRGYHSSGAYFSFIKLACILGDEYDKKSPVPDTGSWPEKRENAPWLDAAGKPTATTSVAIRDFFSKYQFVNMSISGIPYGADHAAESPLGKIIEAINAKHDGTLSKLRVSNVNTPATEDGKNSHYIVMIGTPAALAELASMIVLKDAEGYEEDIRAIVKGFAGDPNVRLPILKTFVTIAPHNPDLFTDAEIDAIVARLRAERVGLRRPDTAVYANDDGSDMSKLPDGTDILRDTVAQVMARPVNGPLMFERAIASGADEVITPGPGAYFSGTVAPAVIGNRPIPIHGVVGPADKSDGVTPWERLTTENPAKAFKHSPSPPPSPQGERGMIEGALMVYDLVVIGGGPGGYHAAVHAAELGLKVLLIEKNEELGGTCLHAGCIPSKSYLTDAEWATIRGGGTVDFQKVWERKEGVVHKLAAGIKQLLSGKKVTVVLNQGEAVLNPVSADGKNLVTVGGKTFEAKNVLLATGTSPVMPPFPFNGTTILTTDELFKIQKLPEKLLIVGGGVIGVEMACAFAAFGSKVTLVEALPEILSTEDPKAAKQLRKVLEARGVMIVTGTSVQTLAETPEGPKATLANGVEWAGNTVLVSIGRRVSRETVASLNRLGVETTDRGFAKVDDDLRTSRAGVFAIGDLAGKTLLAHGAMEEGEHVAEVIADKPHGPVRYDAVPRVTYTFPEIASIGAKEEELKGAGVVFVTGRANYAANGRAQAAGHAEGFVQIYVAKEGSEAGNILGALIVGEQAETLIQLINQAMRSGDTIHDIARANPGHPTYSEIVWEAAKEAARKVPVVHRVQTTGTGDVGHAPHPLYGQRAPVADATELLSLEEATVQSLFSMDILLPGSRIEASKLESRLHEIGLEEHQSRAFMIWLKGRPELAALVTGTSYNWNPNSDETEFFLTLLDQVGGKNWFKTYAAAHGGGEDLLQEVAAAAMEAGALVAAADENEATVLETATRALWRQLRSRSHFRDFMASFGNGGPLVARLLLAQVAEVALRLGVMEAVSPVQTLQTPYRNTEIPVSDYRGDLTMDELVTSINRYNAVILVMRANRERPGVGGHLATGQSVAALRQVLFNNFLRPQTDVFEGDVFMNQGHDSPLDYVDAYLRGYLAEKNLLKFREEPGGGGLSGYFHARGDTAFPAEWATVSMGLAPQLAIQVAYTDRYRRAREQARNPDRPLPPERHVWIMLGDASMAEPESVADIHFAAEERLDNLTYIINVNTNGLDGVIERHGQIMQNMERRFSGAGWKVIKLVTSGLWDDLLAQDREAIMERWSQMNDGELQELTRPAWGEDEKALELNRARRAEEIRELFFGKNDRLRALVADKGVWTYDRLRDLFAEGRGGHDLQKIHDAYEAALAHKGTPTAILALTTKARGLGIIEAANTSHNMKAIQEKSLLDLAHKCGIPLSDADIKALKFYHPGAESDVVRYLKERDAALGGGDFYFGRPPDKPRRRSAVQIPVEALPKRDLFEPFYLGDRSIPRVGEAKPVPDDGHTLKRYLTVVLPTHLAGKALSPDPRSTTTGDIKLLDQLMGDREFGRHVTFIVADEITTFGGQTLPPKYGYFDPMSPITMADYRAEVSRRRKAGEPIDFTEPVFARDGQIIQVGISEARAIAALTALGKEGMMPVWMVYSAFGWRRVGDQIMAATDMRVRGVIVGATAGGSTLKGEGLLHQERADLLMAAANPAVVAYDCAFVFEKAVLWEEAIQRMYGRKEDVLYYLTAYNENLPMPAMPQRAGIREGIIKGGYKFAGAEEVYDSTVQSFPPRATIGGGKPDMDPRPRSPHGAGMTVPRVNLLGSGTLLPYALEAQRMLEKYGVHGDVFSITSYSELRRDALDKQRQKDLHRPGKSWDEIPESERPYVMNLLGDQETPVVAVTDYLKQVPDQVDRWISRYYRSLGTDGFGRSGTHPTLRDYYEITAKYLVYHSLCLLAEKGEFFGDLEKIRAELGIDPDKADPAAADPRAARLEAEALAARRTKDAVPSALVANSRTKRIQTEKIIAVLRVMNEFSEIEVLPDGRFRIAERGVELFIREAEGKLMVDEALLDGKTLTKDWGRVVRKFPDIPLRHLLSGTQRGKPVSLNDGWEQDWIKIAGETPVELWERILLSHSWVLEISRDRKFNAGLRDVARQVEGPLSALVLGTASGRYKMSPDEAEIVRGKLQLIAGAAIPLEAKQAIGQAMGVLDQFVREDPRGGRGPKGAPTRTSAGDRPRQAAPVGSAVPVSPRGTHGAGVRVRQGVSADDPPSSGRGRRGSGTGRGSSGGERAQAYETEGSLAIEMVTPATSEGLGRGPSSVSASASFGSPPLISARGGDDKESRDDNNQAASLRLRLAQVAAQRGLQETASLILRLSEEQLTAVIRKLPRVEGRSRADQVLALFAKHSGSSVEQQIIVAQPAPRASTGTAVNPVVTGSTTALSQAVRNVLPVLR